MKKLVVTLVPATIPFLTTSTFAADEYTGLGDLAGGAFDSAAYGINADGSAVGLRGSDTIGLKYFS